MLTLLLLLPLLLLRPLLLLLMLTPLSLLRFKRSSVSRNPAFCSSNSSGLRNTSTQAAVSTRCYASRNAGKSSLLLHYSTCT
jgi:hypothetical protein